LHANYSHNQFKGAYNNFLGGFGIEGGFIYENMGLGLTFFQNNEGILKNTDVKLMYAYRARFAEKHWLTFGLSAGVASLGQNTNKIITGDYSDPLIGQTQTNFAGGFGINYCWKEELEIDFAIPSYNLINKKHVPLFASLSYNFKLAEDWHLRPIVMFNEINPQMNLLDVRIQPAYKDNVWLQIGYRTSKELLFAAGGGAKNFNIGVAYGFNLSNYNDLNKGNVEILLSYRFEKAKLRKHQPQDIDTRLSNIDANISKLAKENEKQTREIEQINKSVQNLNDELLNEFKGSLNEVKESMMSLQKDEVEIVKTNTNVNEPGIVGKAYFVVVYSSTTREDAEAIVYRMSKQNVDGYIIKDSKRAFYYIYTTALDDLRTALTQAEKERKRGFSGAWVLILK
jgi:type IX secretion system PorP/SprF family membrane protein